MQMKQDRENRSFQEDGRMKKKMILNILTTGRMKGL